MNSFAGRDATASQVDNPSKTKDYESLITTADCIVDFVLKGVQAVGSGLPGIGAVAVVLSAKDKVMVRDCYLMSIYLHFLLRTFIERKGE